MCSTRTLQYQTEGITALTTYVYLLCMCAFVQCVANVRTWRCARETCGPTRGFPRVSQITDHRADHKARHSNSSSPRPKCFRKLWASWYAGA